MFGDVTSANIVGYQNIETDYLVEDTPTHAKYPMRGFTFLPVGANKDKFQLKDVKMANFSAVDGEYLYQLLPASARPDSDNFIYVDLENAMAILDTQDPEEAEWLCGWWLGGVSGEDQDRCDEAEFAVGSAFLGKLGETANAKFVSSGEVNKNTKNVNISNKVYPMFANPVPRAMTLKEITVAGMMAIDGEYIYQLLPASARPDSDNFIYVDLENAMAILDTQDPEEAEWLCGWWLGGVSGEDQDRCDDRVVQAGEAFLGKMGANDNVVVNFPEGIPTPAAE